MQKAEGSSKSRDKDRARDKDREQKVSIKIIETRTVHTDPMHFKSVVQGLTGKDVGGARAQKSGCEREEKKKKAGYDQGGSEGNKGEFDELLKMKFPSPEELKEFWDE